MVFCESATNLVRNRIKGVSIPGSVCLFVDFTSVKLFSHIGTASEPYHTFFSMHRPYVRLTRPYASYPIGISRETFFTQGNGLTEDRTLDFLHIGRNPTESQRPLFTSVGSLSIQILS